jgi:thiamine-monophosphate kinase
MQCRPIVVKVADIGEAGLLQRLFPFCVAGAVGDDGALLTAHDGYSIAITTDVLVDGVHFSDATTSAGDVGWRAAAANLSDLAAMGARPLGITVGLSLPGTTLVAWVEELYVGMKSCLDLYGTGIIGGDVCRSNTISIAITAIGEVAKDRVIQRRNAVPGYAIVVTGVHGKSKAGLELLLNPDVGHHLSDHERQHLIVAHQRPRPRLDVLPKLDWSQPIAGMDSSDGLVDAVRQICLTSGVGARIDRSLLSIDPAVAKLSSELSLDWTLAGGEDFELVLCMPFDSASSLVAKLGAEAKIIGEITTELEIVLCDSQAPDCYSLLDECQQFQHFGDNSDH